MNDRWYSRYGKSADSAAALPNLSNDERHFLKAHFDQCIDQWKLIPGTEPECEMAASILSKLVKR